MQIDLDAVVAGDERRAVARARAVSATARVASGLDVAGMLEQVGGPASSLYGKGRDGDQVARVDRLPDRAEAHGGGGARLGTAAADDGAGGAFAGP